MLLLEFQSVQSKPMLVVSPVDVNIIVIDASANVILIGRADWVIGVADHNLGDGNLHAAVYGVDGGRHRGHPSFRSSLVDHVAREAI